MAQPRCYLVMPHYGQPHGGAAKAFYQGASSQMALLRDDLGLSILTQCFNELWCRALNLWDQGQATHFAMLHADVIPEGGWLDKLYAVMQEHDADVVSAVVAIKDERGLTSTAIDNPDDPWKVERRLTVREVLQLPETFTADDCGYPGRALLMNTGCWLAKLGPWCDRCHFEFRNRIVRNRDGRRVPQVVPEDWGFGRMAHRAGAKVVCTRAVQVQHAGVMRFANWRDWGTWDTDTAFADGPLPALQPEPSTTPGYFTADAGVVYAGQGAAA